MEGSRGGVGAGEVTEDEREALISCQIERRESMDRGTGASPWSRWVYFLHQRGRTRRGRGGSSFFSTASLGKNVQVDLLQTKVSINAN